MFNILIFEFRDLKLGKLDDLKKLIKIGGIIGVVLEINSIDKYV